MTELYEKGSPIDLITATEALRHKGLLEKIGGAAYLGGLTDQVPSVENSEHYARIVREKSILRKLIWVSSEIASEGYESDADVGEYLDKAEKAIFEVTARQVRASFSKVKDILHDTFKKIEELYERKDLVTGVPSGYHELDQVTAGFQPSDLIIVAGRPGMGKTSFVLNIAQYAGIEAGITSAVFSLEMSKEQLVLRLLCSEARIDSQRLRKGQLRDSDWPKLTRAAGALASYDVYLDVALRWFTSRIGAVDLALKDPRGEGQRSGYTLRSLLAHLRRLLMSYHLTVLRYVMLGGFATSAGVGLLGVAIVVEKLISPDSVPVRGWTSMFVTIAFFGGLTLFLLGLILERLSTMLTRAQGHPAFFIVDRSRDELWKRAPERVPEKVSA